MSLNKDKKNTCMKYIQGGFAIVFVLCMIIACKTSKPSTKTRVLFMQSKRATIELPRSRAGKNLNGMATVSEEVSFSNPDNYFDDGSRYSKHNSNNVDLSKEQRLSEVTITARSRFTPEREGKVNIDFVIKVPHELLSSDWRLVLSPIVLADDSTIALPELMLKGESFVKKQLQDYDNYQLFLNTLVDKNKYDSLFLDQKGIQSDIKNRQTFYWDLYHKEYQTQIGYEEWKFKQEDKKSYETARKVGQRAELQQQYLREAMDEVARRLAQDKDTTGIYADYRARFEKESAKLPSEWIPPTIEEDAVPTKYRKVHESGRTINDIKNYAVTEKDSAKIANYRYEFEKIALNEAAIKRKDDIFRELVRYPLENEIDYRIDSIVDPRYNFSYYYHQDFPVTPGLKNLRIIMRGKVQAVDYSSFTLPVIDTLSYFISSMVQLADESLVNKKTKLYKNMFSSMQSQLKFAPDKTNFDPNYADNKNELKKLRDAYNTFTTYNPETKRGGYNMDSINFKVTTSLDGRWNYNYELSEKRAESLKKYLVNNTFSDINNASSIFKWRAGGEDWNTLAKNVNKRNDLPNKSQILTMITEATNPDNVETDIKKTYPQDYKIIKDSIYPLLNKVDLVLNMSRPNMVASDSIQIEVQEGYDEGLKYLQNRDYWKALDILSKYPDYNLGLCLTCMGYNAKAYELLNKLPQTGNTEYLLTIVSARLGNEQEATEHLLKACKMDNSKIYRIQLDPEVSSLVSKYALSRKINRIASMPDEE